MRPCPGGTRIAPYTPQFPLDPPNMVKSDASDTLPRPEVVAIPSGENRGERLEVWSWWRRGRGGCSLFANNVGGPVVSGLLISPRVYALDGETGQSGTIPYTISEESSISYGISRS